MPDITLPFGPYRSLTSQDSAAKFAPAMNLNIMNFEKGSQKDGDGPRFLLSGQPPGSVAVQT
jgi:hypothetical protein